MCRQPDRQIWHKQGSRMEFMEINGFNKPEKTGGIEENAENEGIKRRKERKEGKEGKGITAKDQWISLFQWFHRHPELGYEEFETTAKIKEVLQEYHIETVPSGLKTGVIAVIRGSRKGKEICLRADIDALPVKEDTCLEYASEKEGKMHACGHDFHTTAALCAAALLQENKEDIHGTVYIIFQPAEEIIGGAEEVLRTGILDHVAEFYGFHAEPSLEVGEISCEAGGVMAAVDQFSICMTGKGCHGATPWLGNNPIPVLTALVNDIYQISGENMAQPHTRVISVTHVEAGNTWNIIPEQGYLEGTVRTLDAEDRKQVKKAIHEITDKWNGKNGIEAVIKWHDGPDAVINDRELCAFANEILQYGQLSPAHLPPAMAGEDFSKYAAVKNAKSLYLKIGTGAGPSLHNSRFCVNPEAIKMTAEFFAQLLCKRAAEISER